MNFQRIEHSEHTTEILASGKVLLARLYLYKKVYNIIYLIKNVMPYME